MCIIKYQTTTINVFLFARLCTAFTITRFTRFCSYTCIDWHATECTGCHRLLKVTFYIEKGQIYKPCERCRANSHQYYEQNAARISQRKYKRQEMFQCRCRSKVKMYCKSQHLQSIHHQNWQALQDAEEVVSDSDSE